MTGDIRKISIGPDYKGGAMHYIVGQAVLGDSHVIHLIKHDIGSSSFKIYVQSKESGIYLWKEFNSCIPISIEYNINF